MADSTEGAETTTDVAEETTTEQPGAAGADTAKAVPQDEVNRLVGAARKDGSAAAERKLAEALGMPLVEAKRIIAERKAAEEAAKGDAQKAAEAAAAEKARADGLAAQLAERDRRDAFNTAWTELGMRPDRAAGAYRLTDPPADGEEYDATAAATKAAEAFPEWKAAESSPTQVSTRGATGRNGVPPPPAEPYADRLAIHGFRPQ